MIRGYFGNYDKHPWPMLAAGVRIPSLSVEGIVHLLIDTGSNYTTLGPKDAEKLGIDLAALAKADPVTGVGGRVGAVNVEAEIVLDGGANFSIWLFMCVYTPRQLRFTRGIPSGLGRDILSHFTFVFDEKASRVELLETGEQGSPTSPESSSA